MNKNEEKLLFNSFLEKYKEISVINVEFRDSPDVVITLESGKNIGIELTECFYSEDLMQKSQFQIKFNNEVLVKLKKNLPFKFILDIDLDSKYPLKQNQIKKTIDKVVEICSTEFNNINSLESRCLKNIDLEISAFPDQVQDYFFLRGYKKLPHGISRIHISRYDVISDSYHSESKGGFVPDFCENDLNRILSKKEKSLKKYQKLDEQWLLIIEGGDFYSYFDRIDINNFFKTDFDKVLIFRRWESKIITLK